MGATPLPRLKIRCLIEVYLKLKCVPPAFAVPEVAPYYQTEPPAQETLGFEPAHLDFVCLNESSILKFTILFRLRIMISI